jgi:hypothetical protein
VGIEEESMLEVHDELRGLSLAQLNDRLTPDAQRVLHRVAQRIVAGQAKHGPLVVESDQRNWSQETREELLDVIVYRAIADIANDRVALADALTRTQARCTELIQEVRELRRAQQMAVEVISERPNDPERSWGEPLTAAELIKRGEF